MSKREINSFEFGPSLGLIRYLLFNSFLANSPFALLNYIVCRSATFFSYTYHPCFPHENFVVPHRLDHHCLRGHLASLRSVFRLVFEIFKVIKLYCFCHLLFIQHFMLCLPPVGRSLFLPKIILVHSIFR